MDRLTSLTVFTRVVDCGGFSAAAQRLNMSTTMVSNHVQALENHLGIRLLNRTTRRVSLTGVGREYYERCHQILTELAEADQAASALQVVPRGWLRAHCDTHIVRFVAPAIADFLAANPEVSIDLRTGERMPDLVEEGLEVAIRPTPPPDSTSLIVHQLSTWRHVLCCAPSYLGSRPAPALLSDLAAHNCLRYANYPFGDEWRFVRPDGKPVSVRVSGNLISTSAETLRQVTLKGGGLFLAASFIIADDLEAGRLIPLLPEFRPVDFAINAIYPHRRHLTAKVRRFIDLLANRFTEHRRWMNPPIPEEYS